MDTATSSLARADVSLGELQALNLETLRACSTLPPDARFALAERVRHAAVSAGAWTENPVDRDAAQSILDYWTAQIGSLPDHQLPELVRIAPFDQANGERVRDRATRAYESLSEGPQAAARVLVLRMLDLHDPSIDEDTNDIDVAAASDAFEQAGILRRAANGDLMLAHPALLKSYWATLGSWLAEHDLEMAKLAAVTAGANAWNQAKRQDSYLPAGAKLIANARYRGSSELVGAYIAAAERARVRRWISLALTAFLVGAATVAVVWLYRNKQGPDVTRAPTPAEIASGSTEDANANLKAQLPTGADVPAADIKIGATGYVWLGSSNFPMLRSATDHGGDDQSATLVDPLSLQPGNTIYRIRTAVYLRDALPDGSYKSGKKLGVLEAGAQVQLTGPIQAFVRPSGIQYWGAVRQVVRVFIQYAGPTERADALVASLSGAAFAAQDPEQTTTASRTFTVVYYHASDRPYAEQLIRHLVLLLGDNPRLLPKCSYRGDASITASAGVLEAWVDLDALPVRGSSRPAPVGPKEYCPASAVAPAKTPAVPAAE